VAWKGASPRTPNSAPELNRIATVHGSYVMPYFEKYFTVDEANALLPELRGMLTELKSLRSHLEVSYEQAKPVLQAAKTNGGGKPGGSYLNDVQALNRRLQRFNDLGIQLKDLDRGLVDFPAWREDREILLCWHLGEDAVEFWHELETGFAGRKRL
jgi:hypothetical protein